MFVESEIKELNAVVANLKLRLAHLENHLDTRYVEPVVEATPVGEPDPTEIPVDPSKFLWIQDYQCWSCSFEFACPACNNGTNANLKVSYSHLQGALIKFPCPLCKASLSAPITKVRS